MTRSLGEVEALAARAAFGAGYPWGLAQEAGLAARWLCETGFDGVGDLVRVLNSGFADHLSYHLPSQLHVAWQGKRALCPLACGATLSDCAQRLEERPITLLNVDNPRFLLPFLGHAAGQIGRPVQMKGGLMEAATDGRHVMLRGAFPPHLASVRVSVADTPISDTTLADRANPKDGDWTRLQAFAAKTYAPATEESRRKGAGSADDEGGAQ